MYKSAYEMIRQELVEDDEKYKNLSEAQKHHIAEGLTALIMNADVEAPLSFDEAGNQLERLYSEALDIKNEQ